MSRTHQFIIAFGLLLFAAGLYLGADSYRFAARAVSVDGTVIAMESSSNSFALSPVVRYTDPEGHPHRLKSPAGSIPPDHYVGEKLKVLIDPDAPDTATIDGFFERWGGPLIAMGLGAAFVLITLGVGRIENRGDDTGKERGDPLMKVVNLFLVIGIVLFGFGLYSWQGTRDFVAKTVTVDGTVVAMRSRIGSFTEYPVIRYTDHRGQVRMLYSTAGSSPPAYVVGEKVKVRLDPTVPDFATTAAIDGFFELWGMATMLSAGGIAFMLIVLAFKYADRRGGVVAFGKRRSRRG